MAEIQWQEWKNETFERAEAEGKALFVWIQYRGCRACGKMAEESFSDALIVERLHADFIPIRIDRDERPDIDRHFQRVFSVMLGKEGGWPLTLFLRPDKKPLYVSAYVPPEARDGMMGLGELLDLVARARAEDPAGFGRKGEEALRELTPPVTIEATRIDPKALATMLRKQILNVYDAKHGGYGEGPKYLHVALLKAALVLQDVEGEVEPIHSLRHTLERLMAAPMWDAETGGLYCCALDEAWQVPQRRKSLAENAIMAIIYLRTAEATGEMLYRETAYRICDWALEKMQDGVSGLLYTGEIEGEVDQRIFTAPNALMAAALMMAAQSEDRYRPDALGLLNALMDRMLSGVQLRHQLRGEDTVTYLVDYAALSAALLAAYDLTGNQHFVATSGEIASAAIRRFYDKGRWGVGDGEWNDPTVFVDTTLPSPAATITMVLHRLSELLDKAYTPFVEQTLAVASYELMRRPVAKAGMAEAALRVYGVKNEEIGMRK